MIPLAFAAVCVDCEIVFDLRHHRRCPTCDGSVFTPLESRLRSTCIGEDAP